MNNAIDWIERAAIENFKQQHFTADVLAKEAATTLNVLLAALGAGTAYAVKAVNGQEALSPVEYGAICFTVYMVILSVILVCSCLKIQPIGAIFNEPKNLIQPMYRLEEIRYFELQNVQEGIEAARVRNAKVARSLNCIRLAAALSPLWFLIAFGFHCWDWAWGIASATTG